MKKRYCPYGGLGDTRHERIEAREMLALISKANEEKKWRCAGG